MHVMLVEDDPGIGRFVSRGLAAEGFTVEWLRTGGDARRRLRAGATAAVILDLGLPDIDGTDLCVDLRHAGVNTAILMLTARDSLEDRLDGFRNGADDYLCKPFAFAELLARLRAIIRRRDRGESLVMGDLRIDLRARAVSWAGSPVLLSQREYAVLLCLARAAPEPVGRQEMLDQVWGSTAEINENTVDVYIGYLRRRLATGGKALTIETVRGFGFRLPMAEAL
jgi:DNA-binding response OmpR family regulator